MGGYRQVLVVHEGARLERGLLECAAMFAALDPATRLRVAAMPREGVPPALVSAARIVCAERGVRHVTAELLTQPEQDAVFELARRGDADLLVVHDPSGRRNGHKLLRRFLQESPCAVCFVPAASSTRLRRVVAAIDLGPSSARVMERAVQLCTRAHAEALIAVHALDTAASCPDADGDGCEQRRDDALLALYRCRRQAPPTAARFSPIIALDAHWDQAVLGTAAAQRADLVIVGGVATVAPSRWRRRPIEHLPADCPVPLLVLPTSPPISEQRLLRRVLSETELPFN